MTSPTQLIQHTLTVAELLAELEGADPTARVVITCQYGDRGRTQQALAIREARPIGGDESLEETCYSESGVALSFDWDAEDDDDDQDADASDRGPRDIFLIRC